MKLRNKLLISGATILCTLSLAGCHSNSAITKGPGASVKDRGLYVLQTPSAGYISDNVMRITKHSLKVQGGMHNSPMLEKRVKKHLKEIPAKERRYATEAYRQAHNRDKEQSVTAREHHFDFAIKKTTRKPGEVILHGHYVKNATNPAIYQHVRKQTTMPIWFSRNRKEALIDPNTKNVQTEASRDNMSKEHENYKPRRMSAQKVAKILRSDDIDPDVLGL